MTGIEVATLAAMMVGTGANLTSQAQQRRQASRAADRQEAAMDDSKRQALRTERTNEQDRRRANRRKPNPIAGMAANRGIGGTNMTGPMGLGGASTLGGGSGGMV